MEKRKFDAEKLHKHNKKTIEFELWGSDFNGAFNLNPRNILNLILRTNHLMFIPMVINKFLKLSIVSWLGIIYLYFPLYQVQ